jgi:hypothetical protein
MAMLVDNDFAGMHGYADPKILPMSEAKRDRRYVLQNSGALSGLDCNISRLQTETACSMMHTEYDMALLTGMRDLIPFKQIAEEVCGHMGLLDEKLAVIKAKMVVHKDNNGTLTLANLEPGRSTPTPKSFKVKYHWFLYIIRGWIISTNGIPNFTCHA